MKRAALVSLVSAVLLLPSLAAGAKKLDLAEGQWQTTIKVEMPGMPMAIPPVTTESCITQEDAVPSAEQPGQDCKITKQKITGNTVEWSMQCKDQSGTVMTGSGKVTYKGDKLDGAMQMTVNGMAMQYTMTGKRVGPCKQTAKK